jgi:diacylglycerol kinase family enzyme
MRKIHIITNPLSGKNRKHPTRFDKMLSIAQSKCDEQTQLTAHKPRSLEALLDVVKSIHTDKTDILCVHGGDGTVHQAFTALWKVYGNHTPYPTVAILKGGTMNNIARNIGVGFWSTARSLLNAIATNAPLQISTHHPLVIDETQSGFIYGNVALGPFLEEYYIGSPPSPSKGFRMFCKVVVSSIFNTSYSKRILAPVSMRVFLDETELDQTEFTLLGVSMVADVGFYCRPFYKTIHNPSAFQVIATTCPPLNIVKVIPQLWFAKPTKKPYILDKAGTEIRFEYSTPQISTVDGDVYPAKSHETIRVGPPVRFVHL